MKPIRILHEVTSMNTGGVENLLMNIYRNIDRTKIQFDFMLHREAGEGFFDNEIKELGGKIYSGIPFNPLKHKRYLKSLDDFFKEHKEYKIIHAHNAFSMFTLRSAQKHNIPVRIAHSHNTAPKWNNYKTPFKLYAKSKIKKYATNYFSCSTPAGEYYFGKKTVENGNVLLLKNGIMTDKFKFNNELRKKYREELGLKDEFAIVHIGRFNVQKNHQYLIEIFENINKLNPKIKLFLFGEGELEKQIYSIVKEKKLDDKVIFLGVKGNVNEYLNAMDLFILPSLFEGLPLTGIEAQTNGLPCIISDTVTKEVKITDLVSFISIKNDSKVWAEAIVNKLNEGIVRKDMSEEIINAGYDIDSTVKLLERFYLDKYGEV